jgi:tRNA(Ile)-lysidine synthase TilS/MesJ
MEYVEKQVIILEVNLGQVPKSEEGKQHVQEIIENDIRTKFERFRKWAKENLGAIAAIAISIAGIITTVVVAGKKAIVGASK